MKFYSYVIPRDYGFAPNPYFGYCTLATCKPRIRRGAQVGDWVGAFGSTRTAVSEKLVVLMRVDETMTFDEYWEDSRFKIKRPVFNKSKMYMYGDNIYHHIGDQWMQEPSHHSNVDDSINYINLRRDTQTDRVLIGTEFYYFGNNAIYIPAEYSLLIGKGRNHKVCSEEMLVNDFINYVRCNYRRGINGVPYSRKSDNFVHYGGEK